MAAPTSTNEVTARKLSSSISALWTKIKSTFQPVADRVTSWSSTPSDAKYPSEKLVKDSLDGIAGDYRTKDQDISKGANLVVNGSARMSSSNYNFSSFSYIPTICYGGSAGSFGFNGTTSTDEFISCDFNKTILFSADVKNLVAQSSNCVHRIYVAEFDIDKNAIAAQHVMFGIGTLTSLTQDLNPGDTVVHLADLSSPNWQASNAYQRGFIFWNYKNSYGYEYPPETYSRNQYIGANSAELYANANVNVSAGTITLDNPWSGPSIPAGTKVSRRQSGNTYPYPAYIDNAQDTDWHHIEGVMSGITDPGTSGRGNKFSQGVAFIKVGMYPSYNPNTDPVTNKRSAVANLSVYELSDVDATLSTTSINPLQNKEVTRWHNIVLGNDGYFSGSSAYSQLSLVKSILGSLSLYNAGVNVKIYSFDENDEENATLEWDSANASGTVKTNFNHGQQTGTLFTSAAGKWVKITYTGSTLSYFRGIGIFMNTRGSASSNKNFYGRLRAGTTEYPWSTYFSTSGSLVTTVYSGTPVTTAQVILKPISSDASCAIYGFRCLNTYNGSEDAVLIGTSSFAYQLRNSRKLAVSLSNTSTDTSFNGTADVTNIKTTGTLGVGNGGTGKASVTAGSYVVGNGTSALTEKTPKDAGSDVLKSLDTDNGDVVDGDFIVTSYHVNASTISSTTFVRRTALNLWNYIKSKLSGSDVNIGGNAATATTAQNYDANTGTIRSALAGKSDTGHVHNTDANEVTDSAAASTLDVVTDTTEIVTTGTNGYTSNDKKLYRRPIKSKLWPWIKGLLSSEANVNVSGSSASCTGNAATADAAKAYDPTFSGTNSIASALESKVTEIAFTEGNASAATDLTNVVLCGLKYNGSSLSSGRLSFTLSVTIDRGVSSKGGILRVDLAIGSDGSIYCKRASLTARSGGLEISKFRLVTGTNGGKPVVGVVWNGTTTSGAYMDVRVIDYMALSASASFVYDAVLSNVSNVVWGSSNAIQSASDSDVVHISGSETITGAKEFSRSGQETNFTDSSGSESIVRARTSTSSNNGSCQLNADRTTHRFGVYGRNENGTSKWVSFVGNDGVVNLGSYGDEVRIGGTKFVFNASQLGTEANTFYWI